MIIINGQKFIVINTTNYEHKGCKRINYKVKKPNGKKHYMVVLYENGTFSSVV